MNDIFLIKPPPPVTKVIWKFFDTPDGVNFYSATFCCYESCNPEYRWKFLFFHQTNNYTDTIVTTATLPMMMIPIGILSFFQWLQIVTYNDIFVFVFFQISFKISFKPL